MPVSCDIFCTVVDNYGDIGVCWRLARQLAHEHGMAVRLWVDDLESFCRLCPEVDASLVRQHCSGVEVRHWVALFPEVEPADLVVEAFACELPEHYVEAMAKIENQSAPEAKMDARRQGIGERDSTNQYSEFDEAAANNADASLVGRKPVWINLEYLSAEDWVEGCHKLPSPHPSLPLVKYFFFPGFTPKTGGLLLERDLLARRDAFQSNAAQQRSFWQSIGMAMPGTATLKVSLFCYENTALQSLLGVWAGGNQPVLCLVPEGRALPQVAAFFGQAQVAPGDVFRHGSLEMRLLPFVGQERYDELLWACDINFVRGEDSFVRAQWAGKPFAWHIYPQHDNVHIQKLRAFMALYCAGLPPDAARALHGLWEAWNPSTSSGRVPSTKPLALSAVEGAGQAWNDFWPHRSILRQHAHDWAQELFDNSLALNLLDFFRRIGKMRGFKI